MCVVCVCVSFLNPFHQTKGVNHGGEDLHCFRLCPIDMGQEY